MELEDKMLVLKKKIKAEFWLDPEGDVIYSNACTLYPLDLMVIFELSLIVDTYTYNAGSSPRFRFFNYKSKH